MQFFSQKTAWHNHKFKQKREFVILSLWRSIHKFKVWICILKYGFFILNSKRALNSLDFSLVSLTQNDNALPFLQVDFFAAATPCNPLGRLFTKGSKWQCLAVFVSLAFIKLCFAIKNAQPMKIFTLRQTKTQPMLLIYQKCPNFKWYMKICYKNKTQKPKLRFDSKESLRKQIKFLSWVIALKELYSFVFVRF